MISAMLLFTPTLLWPLFNLTTDLLVTTCQISATSITICDVFDRLRRASISPALSVLCCVVLPTSFFLCIPEKIGKKSHLLPLFQVYFTHAREIARSTQRPAAETLLDSIRASDNSAVYPAPTLSVALYLPWCFRCARPSGPASSGRSNKQWPASAQDLHKRLSFSFNYCL
jgi:hypothetical protein